MKIVGYCALWSIVLALLVSMCAILKEGYIGGRSAPVVRKYRIEIQLGDFGKVANECRHALNHGG